ncbi:hypothetical protein ONS95_012970 [Cadophora gregata]|uniref:uncharacterized protein n=1 Tax=Cadophora gregata TaxID=51156 RepID=UPI0026DBFF1F|nr:uncharacterized protein ONS95_012970 [Cadophora gregata]KAK0101042.1 hypothetical protein ONS96_006272 [Cadophora gregata f. sp. sojae]KAK0115928.1 hypothetical protein ONS95_012970 [Cadophora gregata]
MWRGNNNYKNNNHRARRPADRGGKRAGSVAPRSFGTIPPTNTTSASTNNINARQTATAPGHNGLSGNSREDWGLMGDTRPPTPSEGRAQYYHRAGPIEQQRTRTYDNGTALTFGPDDPIPEPVPGAAFDDQFRQVDSAIRDLQVSNSHGPRPSSTSNAPYQNFRTSTLDPKTMLAYRYPNGVVYQFVPSRNASVEVIPHVRSLVRHLSEQPGTAHPGDSTDTRFGENRPNQMSQDILATSGSHEAIQQGTNVAQGSDDIEGPIHESRGTFYIVRPVPGSYRYDRLSTDPNVPNMVRDIGGELYEIEGYERGSMQDAHPNVPSDIQNFGGYQALTTGYGLLNYQSNVANQSQHFGNHSYPEYGAAPPPPTPNTIFNVPTTFEDIEEPRGRTIERDAGYLRHHRRTAQRGNVLWGQELDERNIADRARGEGILGGDIDSGEIRTFLQFQVPSERRNTNEQKGFTTPRALSPPQFRVTEPSPIAMPENATRQLEAMQTSGRSSAPPAPIIAIPGGYFVTPLYQALYAQDTLRRSSLPAAEGRASSVDSNGENRIFGELAGTVRAPSQEGKGRKLWKKDFGSEDGDKNADKDPEE